MNQEAISDFITNSDFYKVVHSDVNRGIRFQQGFGIPMQMLIADMHWVDQAADSLELVDNNETMFELFDTIIANTTSGASTTLIIEAGNFSLPTIQLRLIDKYPKLIHRVRRDMFHPVVRAYLVLME